MDYEEKYRKYKTLYLNMKMNLRGGDNGDPESIFEKGSKTLSERTNPYQERIEKLKRLASCEKKIISIAQIKSNITEIYKTIGEKISPQRDAPNVFYSPEYIKELSLEKINNVRDELCNFVKSNIIPLLEDQSTLYDKFKKDYRDARRKLSNVQVEDYINFATKENLLGSEPEEIVRKYVEKLSQKLQDATLLLNESFAKEEAQDFSLMGKTPTEMVMSKNNKQCITGCKEGSSFLGKYKYCETKPYTTWSGKYDWDYC